MKFGKLHDLSGVDFTLPEPPAGNRRRLSGAPEKQPELYVGCTGWSMKEWVGEVYPPGSKPDQFLKEYGKQFNCIEMNTTHYRIPNEERAEYWQNQVPADFRFCPKMPKAISHRQLLQGLPGDLDQFVAACGAFGAQYGCTFMQLPPYFDDSRVAIVENFLQNWPRALPLSIEFRHESWFTGDLDRWLDRLAAYHCAAVITDVAGRRDVAHMGLSTDFTVVRFVGNGLIDSDYERLDAWIAKLDEWYAQGLKTAYFFPHEPDNIRAPEAVDYFAKAVQKRLPHVQVRGPQLGGPFAGQQTSLF